MPTRLNFPRDEKGINNACGYVASAEFYMLKNCLVARCGARIFLAVAMRSDKLFSAENTAAGNVTRNITDALAVYKCS